MLPQSTASSSRSPEELFIPTERIEESVNQPISWHDGSLPNKQALLSHLNSLNGELTAREIEASNRNTNHNKSLSAIVSTKAQLTIPSLLASSQVQIYPTKMGAMNVRSQSRVSIPSVGSSESLVIHGQKCSRRESKRMSANVARHYEVPQKPIRRILSDASLQKTRTSARQDPAMIPANHAKTPKNSRLDFFEDSMDASVIQEFDLYKKDWSQGIDPAVLESTARAILHCHLKVLAPSLYNEDVCSALKQTTESWRQLQHPHATHQSTISPRSSESRANAENTHYWLTYKFLSHLSVQHSKRDGKHPLQYLFPASVARFIKRKGLDSPSFQYCAVDPKKILKDYETLQAGPWGR